MSVVVYNQYDHILFELLQPGKVGNFSIEKTLIEKGTILNMYDRKEGRIFKGRYTFDYPLVVLREGGEVWMSDSQIEIESVAGAAEAAKGDVLIGGLGVGLLPIFICDKVNSITVVELHKEVIDLVFPYLIIPGMEVMNDDIFHYLATTKFRYDFIHIDIWNNTTAPIMEIDKARKAASKCLKPGGVVWCWLQELYDRIKDKLPRKPVCSSGITNEPCLICGKTLRHDYAGLCMDCADLMGLSEPFMKGGKNVK